METEIISRLTGRRLAARNTLLIKAGLDPDPAVERTVLVWDGATLAATGSRQGNLLKCIAVDDAYQGEGLTAAILTALREDAFAAGQDHLFLYTKPGNLLQFSSLFFYPVAKTDRVLLMEDRKNGIRSFLNALPVPSAGGTVGAAVMNCNPFTLGHRYLIETAAAECDWVYIFVLSEDASVFSAQDRMNMVRLGTSDLKNVTVLPTGPYLISSATFPTYFLKDKGHVEEIQCALDAEVFLRHFVPRFAITRRYVGSEPLCPVTAAYNRVLTAALPPAGVELREIPRRESSGAPISAGIVRMCLEQGLWERLAGLVPETTLNYLKSHDFMTLKEQP